MDSTMVKAKQSAETYTELSRRDFKREISFWIPRLVVLCIVIISSVVSFLLGCATRLSYTFHQQSHTKEGLSIQQSHRMKVPCAQDQILKTQKVVSLPYADESACYQALVHPAMIVHNNPKRVTILGDDEGTVQEVMKHRTVRQVDLHSMCNDGSVNSCSYHHNGIAINRVIGPAKKFEAQSKQQAHKSDVIFIINPNILSNEAHTNEALRLCTLHDALSNGGVLVLSFGAVMHERNTNIIEQIQKVGFKSIHIYEEPRCSSADKKLFVVAFKNYKTRSAWYRNEAEIQVQLSKRINKRGYYGSSLDYIDGSTILSYQVPSKAIERAFCDEYEEKCDSNFSLPSDVTFMPASVLEVRKSKVSEIAGRGIFAAQDIPSHSVLALDIQMNNFFILPSSWKTVESMYDMRNEMNRADNKSYQGLLYFIQGNSSVFLSKSSMLFDHKTFQPIELYSGYGYGSQLLGETQWTIDSWLLLFSNHGCNFTFNYGTDSVLLSETTASLHTIPPGIEANEASAYSPFDERHLRQYLGTGDYTLREIKKGEEILTNYLSFVDPSEWAEEVRILRSQCSGEEVGEVSDYESGGKTYYGS